MIGKKIRAYREFKGLNQLQLAELSGINVGTIRKYELGIRNPKPDQLEKIASALGLNVSVFFDFKIDTVGDVLSLLFAIDDAVDLSLTQATSNDTSKKTIGFNFKHPMLQEAITKWCQFKEAYEREYDEIMDIKDDAKRQEALDKLESTQNEWKLRAMGTTIGCHNIVRKGTEGLAVKVFDFL